LESAAAILPVICEASGLASSAAGGWEELIPLLADRRALLFLDTAECLLGSGLREILPRWREQAPGVSILLTSLEAAGLEGEHLFSVRPLLPPAIDPSEAGDQAAAWAEADAIRLFESRAQQRNCEWQL